MKTTKTEPKRVPSGERSRPRVLVVDDDEDMRFIYRELLGSRYEILTLEDGGNFFKTVFEVDPDLIILDVDLPGTDGFVLCKRLKLLPRMSHIPIMFVSGKCSDSEFVDKISFGGDAFLTKPVDEEVLRRYVDSLVKLP